MNVFEWPRPYRKLRLCAACGGSFYVVINARSRRHKFAGDFNRKYCGPACTKLAGQVSRQNCRAGRLDGVEGFFTPAQWAKICHMHDWKCAHCGRPGLLTVDHKIPLSRGGSNWPSNLQPLCFRCNVVKNDKVEGAA